MLRDRLSDSRIRNAMGQSRQPWMFSIQADARENRDALLAALSLRLGLHGASSTLLLQETVMRRG